MEQITGSVTGNIFTDNLDISSLLPGIYFLTVETGSVIDIQKFIIE
jgi:hypothetical protein